MASSALPSTSADLLGYGAYASVFEHYDTLTNSMVAVKRINLGPVHNVDITEEVKDVHKEVSLMKEFNHERIVQYIRAEQEANILLIYMEHMSGGSVKEELHTNGALSEIQAKRYTLQLLEGLSYLHGKYIIHRDIKGSNILCDGKGNIKLADFGISKQIIRIQTLTADNTNTNMKGTAYWMAPEVIQGTKYGRRADIWSTGSTLVEMLTTHPPWYHLAPFPAMFNIASLKKGGYVLDSTISDNAKRFLAKTFTPKEQRPRADELLQHSWLTDNRMDVDDVGVLDSVKAELNSIEDLVDGKLLGSGGFTSVYLFFDEKTNKMIAVKKLKLVPVDCKRIQKKAEALCKESSLMKSLSHERIVQYIRFTKETDQLCIYMEHMAGGSVKDQLDKHGALNEPTTRKYAIQILEGLSYLHKLCIIHRNVKGSNVLCDGKGNIKLGDFGISKQMTEIQTIVSQTIGNTPFQGTANWMAPEVIIGPDYGRRADIWSTGATVVEMLTARPPWHKLEYQQVIYRLSVLKKVNYVLHPTHSDNAKNFLEKAFTPEAKDRPRADELLQHPWFALQT